MSPCIPSRELEEHRIQIVWKIVQAQLSVGPEISSKLIVSQRVLIPEVGRVAEPNRVVYGESCSGDTERREELQDPRDGQRAATRTPECHQQRNDGDCMGTSGRRQA